MAFASNLARYLIFALILTMLPCQHSSADQAHPISPDNAVKLFQLDSELTIELVAAEPDVIDPVALAFDEAGRMYVVENRGYPSGPGEGEPPAGTIALLEDGNGDGRYDRRSTFAEGLNFPNGIMAWRGGVLVTDAPYIYFLKDADGDGRADKREIILQGFAEGGSTQLRVSHPTLALDNWIYLTNGLSGGEVFSPATPEKKIKMGGLDLRFHPITGAIETTAGQAQFGLSFNDRGLKFVCSNRKHIEHVVLQPGDLARNPLLGWTQTVAAIPDHGEAAQIYALSEARTTAYSHAGTFTAACGLVIYRGTALPSEYYGNGFVCDPTGNLIHRDVLVPSGATYIAKRAEDKREFLATTDNWFRPVFLANGPTGALYVCDMYRKTIEHPTYLPAEIAKITDFGSGKDRGRIYRIRGKLRHMPAEIYRFDRDGMIYSLAHQDAWVRETAHRLVLEGNDRNYDRNLRNALAESKSEHARAHALWLLVGLGFIEERDVVSGMGDPSPLVREQAIRIARERFIESREVVEALLGLVNDSDARVRFAAALALGDCEDERAGEAIAAIAARGIADPWTRAAALSSVRRDMNAAFTDEFIRRMPQDDAVALAEAIESVARIHASIPENDRKQFLYRVLADGDSGSFAWQAAALCGVAEAMRRERHDGAPLALLSSEIEAVAVLVARALGLARGADSNQRERLEAVRLLGYSDFDTAGETLAALISPANSHELQAAAVGALALMTDDRVGALLASGDRWHGYTASIRGAAASAILMRPARIGRLLDGLETGEIQAWSIDPVLRNQLTNHRDESLRTRARKFFSNVQRTDRSKVYDEYKSILTMAGNREKGREVFRQQCAQCHLHGGEGSAVGPDLTGIGSQPMESILIHVLDPNREVLPGYENYMIELRDGESVSGIIAAETETQLTVRQPLGQERTIARKDIQTLRSTNLSLMPEEIEMNLTRQELRDLIGFLKGEE